ncbi:Uncharacterised protein [Oligella urethralis]|uniref:DUF1653 domain-containing protein n=1 Tax=Oligella urethralis TaxID=90245 RepID=UPI000E061AA6|nr:DUF1653 domain-containing protein [Oligella urethralis]SUA63244.1 Uncharacterised protein [Oligella urethralis]
MKDLPQVGELYRHIERGSAYRIICIANLYSLNPKFPITVIYENIATGSVWARPFNSEWAERYQLIKK